MEANVICLYTDGSAIGNPGPGGYRLSLESQSTGHIKEYSQGFVRTTNNRMELMAVIVGLELLKKDSMKVVVYSDSKYVVDSVEKKWLFGWEKKNFKQKKKPEFMERFFGS